MMMLNDCEVSKWRQVWRSEEWQQKRKSIEEYLEAIRLEEDERFKQEMKRNLRSSPCFYLFIFEKFINFAEREGIMPQWLRLMMAIAWTESLWNPWACGDFWDGEYHSFGMFQINREWWNYDLERFMQPDIDYQMAWAWKILKILKTRYNNDVLTVIRAYNGDITVHQTYNYARNVLNNFMIQPWLLKIERCLQALGLIVVFY